MNEGRARRARGFQTAAIIALISAVLLIAIVEVALRATCLYCTWSEVNTGQLANLYGLPPTPYYVRPTNSLSSYGQAEFDFEIDTNSLGFRDVEHPIGKGSGEVRILAIGDSFTEGQGAAFDATWLNVMGRQLAEANTAKKVRMICAGVAGSDPFYGHRLLVDKLLLYEPDIVLLVVNHSDVMDVVLRGGAERYRPDGSLQPREPPSLWGVYKTSHLARLILFEAFDYTHFVITRTERRRRAQAAVRKLDVLVSEIDQLLAARDIDFVLVLHPIKNEARRGSYDWIQMLRESSTTRGITVLDVQPDLHDFLAREDVELTDLFWPKDGHFTALGYRVFADAVRGGICPHLAGQGMRCERKPTAPVSSSHGPSSRAR